MGKGEIDGSISVDMRTGETSTEHTGRPGRHRGARAVALSVGRRSRQREKGGDTRGERDTRGGRKHASPLHTARCAPRDTKKTLL